MFGCCDISGYQYLDKDKNIDALAVEKLREKLSISKIKRKRIEREGLIDRTHLLKDLSCKCGCHVVGSHIMC